jgi:DNA-binding SARP family transcriptional activator
MVQLSVLGGAALRRDGELVTGRPSQRHHLAVLAYLAASSGCHASRDKLIALLWPELDSARARHRLSVALHVLRQGLGEGCLETAGDTVSLDRRLVATDVGDFVEAVKAGRLQEAVGHYGGAFLDGFHLPDASEFDQWMEGERRRLEGLHRSALERLATESEHRGDLRAAADWWRRLAAEDPYTSSTAIGLMRALAAVGDVAAAVRHARTYSTLVEGELEVPADPKVLELAAELVKNGRIAKDSDADAFPTPQIPAASPSPPTSEAPGPVTVAGSQGRDRDLPAARRIAGWAALAVLVTLIVAIVLSMGAGFGSEAGSGLDGDVVPFGGS